MKRAKFISTVLALFPLGIITSLKAFGKRTEKGFKVAAGESRFGEQFRMKGVTLNVLDLKVSAKDTNGALAIFE
ncbi:hypothetical protein AAE02nite_37910 [Adhaeribacter aerolatus]|uniref:Uncharacterized protein n=1 Tax=Adhaeribacter aerolatus TaxID=670289 RepID=A0A512B2X4_9BACT|nr:hypothetical protein [Adhaeribacter aerolatus]GEO06127.1 hypothetical protein AAE02nite_37910 [Adhaeribacter aerolatus]